MFTIDREFVQNRIVKRERDAHKGNFGKVLVYAGSPGMAGAAILCARAALKSGAGLVRFLIPCMESPLLNILQCSVPEATCVSYKNGMDFLEYSAVVCGPGLGMTEPEGSLGSVAPEDILKDILQRYSSGKLVLDADALNMIAASGELADLVRKSGADIVITPHVGEARRLLGEGTPGIDWKSDSGREDAAERLFRKYGCVSVLKGAGTLVMYDTETLLNTTGNPGMATGGSGDVLSGVIVSLCAQGYTAADAAAMGVWIHGMAGDLAAEELGEMGMISSDIAAYVPAALKLVY